MTSPLVLAVAWTALVLAGFRRWRPPPARIRLARTSIRSADPPVARAGPALLTGRAVLRLLHRPAGDGEARALGRALLAAAPVLAVAPAAAPAVGLAVWVTPRWRARRIAARRRAVLAGAVPEAVDLFAVAVGAGLTVPLAVEAVADRGVGPVAEAMAAAGRRAALGVRLADVLDALPGELGEPVRPLTAALVASERYGVPLATTLDRLASDLRDDRRRQAEEAARRIPVKLLFPLVVCILPAFALLTVVPLAASALGSLRL